LTWGLSAIGSDTRRFLSASQPLGQRVILATLLNIIWPHKHRVVSVYAFASLL